MAVAIDLTGKTAIVTGSGRGIGRETALLLAKAGACVTVADIDLQTATSVADEIKALGVSAIAVRADITKAEEARAMVKSTLDAHGRVDILVNNAARWTTKLFKDLTPED